MISETCGFTIYLQRRLERYCTIIPVWTILHGHAPNDINMMTNPRLGVKASIPYFDNGTQGSVRTDYDNSFTVRGAQLWNAIPAEVSTLVTLEAFKVGLGKFLERYPDTPPVPGYSPLHGNSLLSWRRTHSMPFPERDLLKPITMYHNVSQCMSVRVR